MTSESVQTCVFLNRFMLWSYHTIPKIQYFLGCIRNAKFFSVLDAKSGFHQVVLNKDSRLLTTFITHFERYCYNRLPFGIFPAPEYYHGRIQKTLEDCKGSKNMFDDVIVFGTTEDEHNERLFHVLSELQKAGVTLNKDKLVINERRVEFLGHIIDEDGISLHPDKVKAMIEMEAPTNKLELQQFLGTLNFLTKAIPNRSTTLEPLYSLLKKDRIYTWDYPQEKAFRELKVRLTTAPVLAVFDPAKETIITADASAFGIGAALLQRQEDNNIRPIAYVSRSLSDSKKRYAQIEKEALALTWACEKFEMYITGIHVNLETDHKPLVPIFITKSLDSLTPKLQRCCMKLMRFDYSIYYVPGKELVTADTLSRKPLPIGDEITSDEDFSAQICGMIQTLPVTPTKLSEIISAKKSDEELAAVRAYITYGWPEKRK